MSMMCMMSAGDIVPYVMLTVAVLLAMTVWGSANGYRFGEKGKQRVKKVITMEAFGQRQRGGESLADFFQKNPV